MFWTWHNHIYKMILAIIGQKNFAKERIPQLYHFFLWENNFRLRLCPDFQERIPDL
jgi:hypothetical protein